MMIGPNLRQMHAQPFADEPADSDVVERWLRRAGMPQRMDALDEPRDAEGRRRIREALIRTEQRFQAAADATRELIRDWQFADGRVWLSDAVTSE
ncbi:MAG: hypothetical protein ACLGH0_04670, partial [Thermoanaerobaculia bacterium]